MRHPAVHRAVEHRRRHQVQRRLCLGHVDVLALAGAPPVFQRPHHRRDQPAGRGVVGIGAERPAGRPVRPTHRVEESRDRRGHRSEARQHRQRPGLAHQAARRHDHVGPALAHLLPAHPEAGHALRREGLHDHVGPVDEIPDDVQRSRLGHVQTDAPLAGVHVVVERRVLRVADVVTEGLQRTGHLEPGLGFHPDDVGPVVGQHPRRCGPRHRPHEVEHLDVLQRTRSRGCLGAHVGTSGLDTGSRPDCLALGLFVQLGQDFGRVLAELRRRAERLHRRGTEAGIAARVAHLGGTAVPVNQFLSDRLPVVAGGQLV